MSSQTIFVPLCLFLGVARESKSRNFLVTREYIIIIIIIYI